MVADNLFVRMACADCVDVSANWSAARWGPDPDSAMFYIPDYSIKNRSTLG